VYQVPCATTRERCDRCTGLAHVLTASSASRLGIEPTHHAIQSIGQVELRAGRIDLGSAEHDRIRPHGPIATQRATVHRITGSDAERSIGVAEALNHEPPRAPLGSVWSSTPDPLHRVIGCPLAGCATTPSPRASHPWRDE
jgi:hypothetical protein